MSVNKPHSLFILTLALVLVGSALARDKPAETDKRTVLMQAMLDELQRSKQQLKMPDYDLPYFIAFEMKDDSGHHIHARYGSVFKSDEDRTRRLRTEVRVGSYAFDNVGSKKSDFSFSYSPSFRPSTTGPIDDDVKSLRTTLWLMTDDDYKEALQAYMKHKGGKVTEVEKAPIDSFSKEAPQVYSDPPRKFTFQKDRWEAVARVASAAFQNHPEVFDSYVNIDGAKEMRIFVNSEGSRILTERAVYSFSIQGQTRAPDGMILSVQKTVYVHDEGRLPSAKEATAIAQQIARNLEALRLAPVLEPFTGPAILDGEATGVLFHEVVGHRLEGERQLDDEEGKTFKGQVGKPIIPEFLTLVDDPSLQQLNGITLNGYYRFDDEGVAARRVFLIKDGLLKEFLTSRTPVEGLSHSNGHGRSAPGEKPRARMGNTIVQSSRMVPYALLKQLLLEEIKKQNKPYGLIIRNITGGSTQTSSWGYQAYKGMPEMVYRVSPDGREELVRGVEIVGTPIASINKIVATSDNISIFNGYCGAESGYVPVSASAPDVLMSEIELQRTLKKTEKGPILPSPWAKK